MYFSLRELHNRVTLFNFNENVSIVDDLIVKQEILKKPSIKVETKKKVVMT